MQFQLYLPPLLSPEWTLSVVKYICCIISFVWCAVKYLACMYNLSTLINNV